MDHGAAVGGNEARDHQPNQMTTQISYQFEGRNYTATLNHQEWKTTDAGLKHRSWNIYPEGNDITREFVLVQVDGRDFRTENAAQEAAAKAIQAAQ